MHDSLRDSQSHSAYFSLVIYTLKTQSSYLSLNNDLAALIRDVEKHYEQIMWKGSLRALIFD